MARADNNVEISFDINRDEVDVSERGNVNRLLIILFKENRNHEKKDTWV